MVKKKEILRINEGFYGELKGRKAIAACLLNNSAEQILMKHLVSYAEKYNATHIDLQRGYTENDIGLREFLVGGHPEQESKTTILAIN